METLEKLFTIPEKPIPKPVEVRNGRWTLHGKIWKEMSQAERNLFNEIMLKSKGF